MCAQKRIVIALCGKTCSGKSTTAKKLAELLSCPIYSASDSVRMRSRELGISPNYLSLTEHRKIDEATRSAVQSTPGSLVVEGSFVDALLGDVGNVYRVELICGEEERRRRFVDRNGRDGLDQRDKDDSELRHALHGDNVGALDLTFDTTSKTTDQVAEGIVVWLETKAVEVRD
jgi:cytidylate kinase